MNFWIRHGFFDDDDGSLCLCLPAKINTRRNRRRAFRLWQVRELYQTNEEFKRRFLDDGEVHLRQAAHLADYLSQGGTVKRYSHWSGVKVRHLSKLLDDFRRRRLPGQNQLKEAV